jgi:hypothetical protein
MKIFFFSSTNYLFYDKTLSLQTLKISCTSMCFFYLFIDFEIMLSSQNLSKSIENGYTEGNLRRRPITFSHKLRCFHLYLLISLSASVENHWLTTDPFYLFPQKYELSPKTCTKTLVKFRERQYMNPGFFPYIYISFHGGQEQRSQCFLSSLPFSISHHGSIWVLPVIFLLITNTVSPVRACLMSIYMLGEVLWDLKRRRSWDSKYSILSG